MKNKIFIIFTFVTLLFASNIVVAENISIIAKNVTFDKKLNLEETELQMSLYAAFGCPHPNSL